jgi:(S)-ureidoglycine aminohydrolase
MKIILIIASCLLTLPVMAQLTTVNPGVYKWADLPVKTGPDRESRKILEGESGTLEFLEIHATTQFKGAKPSEAHANKDIEECIIVKEGKLKVIIDGKSSVLGPGGVISLMPHQMHSVENVGDNNLTYYVMMYRSKGEMDLDKGETLVLNADSLASTTRPNGSQRKYFDRSTVMLERFEMHVTRLERKGESHAPHQHITSEIILMISGDSEMLIGDEHYRATAGDLYFIPSELLHGIRNVNDAPCSYIAFTWR